MPIFSRLSSPKLSRQIKSVLSDALWIVLQDKRSFALTYIKFKKKFETCLVVGANNYRRIVARLESEVRIFFEKLHKGTTKVVAHATKVHSILSTWCETSKLLY